jgi:DNA-directed RNA polymerase subunit M/transcription elongation factor TFIIS
MAAGYCPKCHSRLYPDDEKYMKYTGVCGYCVSFDKTGRYRDTYNKGVDEEMKEAAASAKKRLQKYKRTEKPWWID